MEHESILIVEDEENIRELIRYNLEKEGYRTSCAGTGEEALAETLRRRPDLIVLDLMLPGLNGLDVCRQLKQDEKTREIPILMVTARNEDSDVVLGLELGAEDYVAKPFSPKVLVARIRAALRRTRTRMEKQDKRILSVHGIAIDTVRFETTCAGKPVQLSVSEFSILAFLARNPGWVFSRGQIIAAVKGADYPVTERSVDVQILGLRKKLGEWGTCIETVRGIGYRMREEEHP